MGWAAGEPYIQGDRRSIGAQTGPGAIFAGDHDAIPRGEGVNGRDPEFRSASARNDLAALPRRFTRGWIRFAINGGTPWPDRSIGGAGVSTSRRPRSTGGHGGVKGVDLFDGAVTRQ